MTIPTRDELIERTHSYLLSRKDDLGTVEELMADFALSEIRRAVAEELEALRRTLSASLWNQEEKATALRGIDRRLAALRQIEQPPGAATVAEPLPKSAPKKAGDAAGSTPAPGATNVAAPALSPSQADMDALSKACRLVAERAGFGGWLTPKTVEALNHRADHLEYLLRAASASVPVPEPEVDVFVEFSEAWHAGRTPDTIHRAVRDWFGPLVAALEKIESETAATWVSDECRSALSALRQRAQEASRG